MYFLIARNYTTCTIIYPMVYKNLVYVIYVRHAHISNIKQLLDEDEHDIINYQNRGLCYLPKPKAEADNTDTRF